MEQRLKTGTGFAGAKLSDPSCRSRRSRRQDDRWRLLASVRMTEKRSRTITSIRMTDVRVWFAQIVRLFDYGDKKQEC